MLLAEVLVNRPLEQSYYYTVPDGMDFDLFYRVEVNFGGKKIIALVINIIEDHEIRDDLKGIKLKPVIKVIDSAPIMDRRLYELSEWIAKFYICAPGESAFALIPSAKNPKKLSISYTFNGRLAPLNNEQKIAFEAVKPAIGTFKRFLLHGITGSGKTEVYKHLVREALEKNYSVIILIPEIALTPQTLERFYNSFGPTIAVYHSRLTPSQRLGEWKRAQSGEARVVIGPRSAVFLPVQNLGLIIMDEEHESSYKSGQTPRYHARQVAYFRCKKENAVLLLGSATPQIESYYAATRGEMQLLKIDKRYGNSSIPDVEIIDMKTNNKGNSLISEKLFMAMLEEMNAGYQILLFLNRRGFSPVLMCANCGHVMSCPNCDVPLTLHKKQHILKCHHCDYTEPLPERCPKCGSTDFKELGTGTEKLDTRLTEMFPQKKIARMDLDTTKGKNRYKEILESMKKGEIDILVGTQMIAKGHDIAGINLVGALMPDIILNIPDFRSPERAFILLTQVIGRAGRRQHQGRAFIQTYLPEHEAIVAASRQDYVGFFNEEIKKRQAFQYPPFVRLGRAVVRGTDIKKVESFVSDLKKWQTKIKNSFPDIITLGPVSCPMEKLNNQYRYHVILKSKNIFGINMMLSAIKTFYKKHRLSGNLYLELDIDPLNLI